MKQEIEVPSEIYKRLEQHAKGFDTPANVIGTLLDYYEGGNNGSPKRGRKKDTTKYSFDNQVYGKGKLVLAVVKKFVSDNPEISFDKLLSVFPKDLQGSLGVIDKYDAVQKKFENKPHKRHFLGPLDIISLSDCKAVVSSDWGISNINDFTDQSEKLGYEITPVNK